MNVITGHGRGIVIKRLGSRVLVRYPNQRRRWIHLADVREAG